TAMLLARAGRRVLLVDRATFPSDIMSTHNIQPEGVAFLHAWGLLDRLLDSGAPRLARITSYRDGTATETPFMSPPGRARFALAPRRTHLDAILVEAAVEAGAELRTGFSLQTLIRDDAGRVSGI